MDDKIKISAVSYLNSKPFLYGLYKSDFDKKSSLYLDCPAESARKLISGEVDLGLVPVAVIPELKNPYIISDFCIGASGAVKTVCIYADFPLEQIETIYLDYQSRTSVQLLKILLRDYWKISPKLLSAPKDFIDLIDKKTAGLVIGDRTIGLDVKHPYVYDLAAGWVAHKKLPFVFAAWVSNRQLSEEFIDAFNSCLSDGISRIDQVAELFQSSHPNFDIREYYTKYISYNFDAPKKTALEKFLSLSKSL